MPIIFKRFTTTVPYDKDYSKKEKKKGKSMFQSLLSPREPASAFATTIMYGFGSGKDASTILHHERLIMK